MPRRMDLRQRLAADSQAVFNFIELRLGMDTQVWSAVIFKHTSFEMYVRLLNLSKIKFLLFRSASVG